MAEARTHRLKAPDGSDKRSWRGDLASLSLGGFASGQRRNAIPLGTTPLQRRPLSAEFRQAKELLKENATVKHGWLKALAGLVFGCCSVAHGARLPWQRDHPTAKRIIRTAHPHPHREQGWLKNCCDAEYVVKGSQRMRTRTSSDHAPVPPAAHDPHWDVMFAMARRPSPALNDPPEIPRRSDHRGDAWPAAFGHGLLRKRGRVLGVTRPLRASSKLPWRTSCSLYGEGGEGTA